MKKTVYILFILISIKLSAQDNMTSLSFRNISSLSTRVGAPGLAITTQGFRNPGDGGGGRFRWDATSTATPIPGFIVKNPSTSVGAWVRDMTGALNVLSAGADPTGVLDNAPLFNQIFNISGTCWQLPYGTYRISSTITLTASNVSITGLDRVKTAIIGDPLVAKIFDLHTDSISNVTISTMKLQNNFVLDRSNGPDTNGISVISEFSTLAPTTAVIARGLHFNNLLIKAPYSCADGIVLIGQRGGQGGVLTDWDIQDCIFDSVGRMAIEVLGVQASDGHNPYVKNGRILNCNFNELGGKALYGMAVSLGSCSYVIVQNLVIKGAKDIGVENAQGEYCIISNVKMSGSKKKCLPYTVQNFGGTGNGGYVYGNSVDHFSVTDSVDIGPQLGFQKDYKSSNNSIPVDSAYTQVDNIINGSFSGDFYSSSKTLAMNFGSSIDNTFSGCTIKGAPSSQLLNFHGGSKRNRFIRGCNLLPDSTSGFFIASQDSATDNTIENFHTGSGTPNGNIAGKVGDSYMDLTGGNFYIKTAGNTPTSRTGWSIVQSPWNRTGNYTTITNDSVGIGTTTPTSKLDVNGRLNIELPDTSTIAGDLIALNITMEHASTQGSRNMIGIQPGIKIDAGTNILNGYYSRTNVFNPVGTMGHGFGFYSQGGTFTNINTFTHYICDDMTLGSGGLGVVLGFDGRISAKTGSFNLNISGTAANYFNGPIWMGATAATPSAQLFMSSTTQGFKPPSMTTTQKLAISTPVEGLEVYDLTLHQMSYYNGSAWVNF